MISLQHPIQNISLVPTSFPNQISQPNLLSNTSGSLIQPISLLRSPIQLGGLQNPPLPIQLFSQSPSQMPSQPSFQPVSQSPSQPTSQVPISLTLANYKPTSSLSTVTMTEMPDISRLSLKEPEQEKIIPYNAPQMLSPYPIPITYPVQSRYRPEVIKEKRDWIGNQSVIPPNFTFLNNVDLERLFHLYNQSFFNNALPKNVRLNISKKQTRIGGSCSAKGCNYVIKISEPIISGITESSDKTVNGLICRSRLECLQLILEHEIIHLVINSSHENLKSGVLPKIYDTHGDLFKQLTLVYFGHTSIYHQLLNSEQSADSQTDLDESKQGENTPKTVDTSLVRPGNRIDFYPTLGSNGTLLGEVRTGQVIKVNPKTIKVLEGPNRVIMVPKVLVGRVYPQ